MKITSLEVNDLRFPTSLTHAGTDAVHTDPDYSAAYVILHTDAGLEGHGFTFVEQHGGHSSCGWPSRPGHPEIGTTPGPPP